MAEPYILETTLELPLPLAEVFAFFADAENLGRITPPWLHFQILTPCPIAMRAGAMINYRIRLRGLPIRWRTEISVYEPPHRFVDRQVRGPYLLWEHTHLFEEVRQGGAVRTKMTDQVRYRPRDIPRWMPLLGGLAHRVFVRPELERIFAYRTLKVRELLAGDGEKERAQ